MDLNSYKKDDIDFTDILYEQEIEDLIPSSLKDFSEINEILINSSAKKSFKFEKEKFTNKVNSIDVNKNIYLKSILDNIKNYLNAKNKKVYTANFINKRLNDEKDSISYWLIDKDKRIKKILDSLNLSSFKNKDLYHLCIDPDDEKVWGARLIFFFLIKRKKD